MWWGCEIVDLPLGAPEYQAIGLGEVGHTLSTLGAGLCVQVVPKCHALSVTQALGSSSPRSPCALSFQVLILIGIFCRVRVWQMAEFDLLGTR